MRVVTVAMLGLALCSVTGSVACASRTGAGRYDHPALRAEVGRPPLAAPNPHRVLIEDAPPIEGDATEGLRARIAEAAASVVGAGPVVVGGRRYRMDCSGVVRGIYAKAGFPLGGAETPVRSDSQALWDLVQRTGSLRTSAPRVGDLVFFDDTYDRDRDGRFDDPLSHVAVVERIEPREPSTDGGTGDGTVVMVHRVGARIVRARMTLARPHDRYDEKKNVLNHYLRAASGGSPAKTTAELFVAFGSLPLTEPKRLAAR
jgi:hypothetical protein